MQQTFLPAKPARLAKVAVVFLMVICISGCWDQKEIDHLIIITAIGIDLAADDQIEVSAQIVVPKNISGGQTIGGGSSTSPVSGTKTLTRNARGATIADAVSKLQRTLPMTVFWGHSYVFVVGEKLAKAGLADTLDYILRNANIKESGYVFVGSGSAIDYLEVQPVVEINSAEVLRRYVESGGAVRVKASDLAKMLLGSAKSAILPQVGFVTGEKNRRIITIKGIALFREFRMVGSLDVKQTQGILWIRNIVKPRTVTVTAPLGQGSVSVQLLRSGVRLQPKIEGGEWNMTETLSANGNIIQDSSGLSSQAPDFYRKVEAAVRRKIEDRVRSSIDIVKNEYKVDVLEFANAFHRKYPTVWKKTSFRWAEVFPDVQDRLEVKVHILKPGIITEQKGMLSPTETERQGGGPHE